MSYRIGHGIDFHKLVEGREFWLGGILIPHTKGALGHSDADVLIHAICDALLGAANLRDIGFHFPNTEARYKDQDTKQVLKRVIELLKEKNYRVGNINATVVLEKPKINPHIPAMKK